uniref:Ig-like domain-containing protein n=1 Tax=Hucho hucho TaxID=62062 RepID=A0A4W5L264_9TELE
MMLFCSILLISALVGMVSGDSVTPDKEEYTPTEGTSETLKCTYETSSDNILLYWYRHYSNQAPQFILYKGARSWSSGEHIPNKRYKSTTSWTSTELVITSLTLADTALYYCALRVDTQWYNVNKMLYNKPADQNALMKWKS